MQRAIVWIVVLSVIVLVGIGMMFALRAPRDMPKTYPADKGQTSLTFPPIRRKYRRPTKSLNANVAAATPLARPINSDFEQEEWRTYVYKMMRKPGSGLTPKTAEPIIEFLIYDEEHR